MPVTPLPVALKEPVLPGDFAFAHGFPSGHRSRYRCRICWGMTPNSKGCDDWQDRALDGVCDECWGAFGGDRMIIKTREADGEVVVETEASLQ